MISFTAVLFFAVTGLTLNHPTWFYAAEQSIRDDSGSVSVKLLDEPVDDLAIAEYLRLTHHLQGTVVEFETDEFESMVVFKGPGYAADVFIDRKSGHYTLTETSAGLMTVLNDLHKGRDTGPGWSWVIDISAVFMVLVSLSGFGLIFFIRRRRRSGLVIALAGTAILTLAWALLVP